MCCARVVELRRVSAYEFELAASPKDEVPIDEDINRCRLPQEPRDKVRHHRKARAEPVSFGCVHVPCQNRPNVRGHRADGKKDASTCVVSEAPGGPRC